MSKIDDHIAMKWMWSYITIFKSFIAERKREKQWKTTYYFRPHLN